MNIGKNQILALLIIGSIISPVHTLNMYTLSNNDSQVFEKELSYLPKPGIPHDPILIDGNAELDAFCSLDGTDGLSWATAHVIKDYDIDAGLVGGGIVIRNTDRYLVIKNCTAINSGDLIWDLDAGIEIDGCTNVNITMCDVNHNAYGIHIQNSMSINVSLTNSSNNIYYGNYIKNSESISLYDTSMHDNRRIGIFISKSNNSILRSNSMMEDGLRLTRSFGNDIDTSNLVKGKPIHYYEDQNDLTLDNVLNVGQMILVNCNSSVISNTNISHSAIGFLLSSCDTVKLENNYAKHNNFSGFLVEDSISVYLTDNNASYNNRYGIFLNNSLHTVLESNIMAQDGLFIEKSFNSSIDTTNTVNGNPVYYYENKSQGILQGQANAGQAIFVNCSGTTIRGWNTSLVTHGILVTSCKSNTITNCNPTNCYLYGILMEHSENNTLIENSCSIGNLYGTRINYSHNNTICNNIFSNNDDHGLVIHQSTHNIVENNTVLDNGYYGIFFYIGSHYSTIRNNTITSDSIFDKHYGLILFRSNNCEVYNNTINDNYIGLLVWMAEDNSIYNNTMHDNLVGCLLHENTENITITNNDLSENVYCGIWISTPNSDDNTASNNNTISKNIINSNTYYGIWIQEGFNNIITKNIINSNGYYGVYIESGNNNIVLENDIQFNSWNNIVDYGIDNICLISSFTTNITTILVNEFVQFNDSSIFNLGQSISYQWNFGDGSPNSTLQNPTHQFTDIGTYDVTLTFSDTLGHVSLYTLQIIVFEEFLGTFSVNSSTIFEGEYVQCTVNTTGGILPLTYHWNFGDGSPNSTLQNPIHQFTHAGNYQITLIVYNSTGDYSIFTAIVNVLDLVPEVIFYVSETEIMTGENITFTSNITGGNTPFSYHWNFGDGSPNSTLQNPIHQFTTAGEYTITLTVQDFDGDLVSYSMVITVTDQSFPLKTIYIIIGAGAFVGVGLLIILLIIRKKKAL